jgi:hypothetical protein
MSDNLKKLTGKNPADYEPIAYNLINIPDVDLFKELVDKDDFLFDFIKENVSKRLEKVCNQSNYKNLLEFLKFYSPSYEEFIVSTLAKYATEDLTDTMLEIFVNGNDNEKTYCAKYFSYIQDTQALDLLKKYAYSDNNYLSANCAFTLAKFNNQEIYNDAIEKLHSNDDYEQLSAVKFLVSYGNQNATEEIIKTIKKSAFAENMASELPYLYDLAELIKNNRQDGLYILNIIINGLGETVALSQLYDFNIYNILEDLIKNNNDSMSSVVLLNACEKFTSLTENDEYLFDESKEVKDDVYSINKLLESVPYNAENLIDNELKEDSLFVFTALDFTTNTEKVRSLLNSKNQTLILKSVEILKELKNLTTQDKNIALENISNTDIKNIILAIN